jgi:hypothetical protein
MPLLAVIVGNQQKTSSATICTARAPGDTTANPRVQSLYIEDAGEGGLINL